MIEVRAKAVAIGMAILLAQPVALAEPRCFRWGPTTSTLTGEVLSQTFWGPPGYGEDPKDDSKETQALLKLDLPICVQGAQDDPGVWQQFIVTLVPLKGEKLTTYVGKRVTVTGKLFPANTGHHRTPVLIELDSVVRDTK